MSFKDKAVILVENDRTIQRLLLLGLLVAGPSLHYLCSSNTYDPFWLRGICCLLSAAALGMSFTKYNLVYKYLIQATILSYLVINNGILLGVNGFAHVYLFSSITIFISLTLFCRKGWEFVTISLLNSITILIAYFTAPKLAISGNILVLLIFVFTLIAYISFLVMMSYQLQFKKAISDVMELNNSLLAKEEKLRKSREQLHALISSVNDTIFEWDENIICTNVWFGAQSPIIPNPRAVSAQAFI